MKNPLLHLAVFVFAISVSFSGAADYTIASPTLLTKEFKEQKDLLQKAYDMIGISVKWEDVPAARALILAEQGKTDADFLRGEVEASSYQTLVRVDVPVMKKTVGVYGRVNLDYHAKQDLSKFRFIGIIGKTYYQKIADSFGIEMQTVVNEIMALKMISIGRGDLTLLFDQEADQLIEQAEVSGKVARLGETFVELPMYHHVHRKHAEIVPLLEESLRALLSVPMN